VIKTQKQPAGLVPQIPGWGNPGRELVCLGASDRKQASESCRRYCLASRLDGVTVKVQQRVGIAQEMYPSGIPASNPCLTRHTWCLHRCLCTFFKAKTE